jgi:hypothetical protein
MAIRFSPYDFICPQLPISPAVTERRRNSRQVERLVRSDLYIVFGRHAADRIADPPSIFRHEIMFSRRSSRSCCSFQSPARHRCLELNRANGADPRHHEKMPRYPDTTLRNVTWKIHANNP